MNWKAVVRNVDFALEKEQTISFIYLKKNIIIFLGHIIHKKPPYCKYDIYMWLRMRKLLN